MKNTSANKLTPLLLFIAAFALTFLILIVQKGELPIRKEFPVDEPAPRTVFSPLHFQFVNTEETTRLRQEKENEILPVYSLDPEIKQNIFRQTQQALKDLAASRQSLAEPQIQERILKVLTALSARFLNDGVLEDERKKELLDSGKFKIEYFDPAKKSGTPVEVKNLVSFSEAKTKALFLLEKEGLKEQELKKAASDIFTKVIRPNLFFNVRETDERLKQAGDSVSQVMVEVKRGEMVTQKGLLITPKEQMRLIQMQKQMAKKNVQSRLLMVGLFVLMGFGISWLYLKQFEPKEIQNPRFLILVLSIFILTLAIEKMTLLIPGSSPYLLPGALAAVLLTILGKTAWGILGSLALAIFSAPLAEFRTEVILMLFLGSLVGSFSANGIRKRIHFLKVGFAMGVVNAGVLIAFFLFQGWSVSEAFGLSPLGLANGFLVTALAFFLVPVFEQLFNVTTDITLLELSDLNHPLLKRMVLEAPGTYHHSLVVSTLAESACEAIGANALLARVGSYFHDIGKIARSEYFTENQTPETKTRHEKLTPTMSCLVIMSHVKEGIELARKYKLKDIIVRFIPEHQGKGVIYYFYKKALDQAGPGEVVRADDFRYPGPKPQSRETAVALLADSVEASSRSLKDVSPPAIRVLVRKIINEKFIDGQLDECDLTLKDLHKIQESFVRNLLAIFHTRVSYPASQEDPSRPDIFESDQFTKFH